MEMHRSFALQRFRNKIEGCTNIGELQQMSVKLMKLYLHQQDTINQMVKKGWLPNETDEKL